MPTLVKAAILGVIQGLFEFLPVSSTAHLLLAGRALGYDDPGGVFTVMIQLGSILAVVWLYRAKLLAVAAGLGSQPEARRFASMIALATLPLLAAGALLSGFVRSVLYGSIVVIAAAFIAGGIVMLIVERMRPTPDVLTVDEIPVGRAFAIGCFQALALIPGVSRSGGTIVAAMAMRVDRPAAAEFTFFLAMPAMTGAFLYDLVRLRGHVGAERVLEIAVGFVMAFVASLLVVRPFLGFVRRAGFAPFAWYRIAFGVLLLAAFAAGWV
jgi:undecaprenyl-diphosphatase